MKTLLFFLAASVGFAQSSGVGSNWTVVTGTLQSAATANGNGTILGVQGLSSLAVTVNCSVACSGGTTITFQGSQDGTNYVALSGTQPSGAAQATAVTNQGTTPTVWFIPIAGLVSIRAPISSYSAGTITVTATAVAVQGDDTVSVLQATASLLNATVVGLGTAGSPSGGVVSVQGVTSGQALPISGAVSQTSGPWTQNLTQLDGSALGAPSNYGTSPGAVTVPGVNAYVTNTPPVSQSGTWTVRVQGNGGAAVDGAPGSSAPANAIQTAGTDGTNTRVAYMDPCAFSAWTYYPINVSANTQVIAGSSGKNVYVCKLFLAPVAAAANVNLVESATSGNACATSPTGMLGGATAALGAQNAANGGFVLPADTRAWAKTATSGDALCIFASAQVTGVLAYVQF